MHRKMKNIWMSKLSNFMKKLGWGILWIVLWKNGFHLSTYVFDDGLTSTRNKLEETEAYITELLILRVGASECVEKRRGGQRDHKFLTKVSAFIIFRKVVILTSKTQVLGIATDTVVIWKRRTYTKTHSLRSLNLRPVLINFHKWQFVQLKQIGC